MKDDKVIEVLEILLKSDYTDIPEISKALTQAINLIKENGELRKENKFLKECVEISTADTKFFEDKLTELKAKYEAVASEGLGVEGKLNIGILKNYLDYGLSCGKDAHYNFRTALGWAVNIIEKFLKRRV